MNKVKTLDDLRKMRETLRSTLDIREKSNHPEQMAQPDAWGIAMPNRLSRLPCQVKNLLFSDM